MLGGWEFHPPNFIIMIKEIVASTLLTASIGIQNTQIKNETKQQSFLTDIAPWRYSSYTEFTDEQNFNVQCYRDKQAQHKINNQSYKIRERSIEYYQNFQRTTPNAVKSNVNMFNLVINIQKKPNIEYINDFSWQQIGQILTNYNIRTQTVHIYTVNGNYDDDENIYNFLNGETIYNYEDYETLVQKITDMAQDGTEITPATITNDNYYEYMNNLGLGTNGEIDETTFIVESTIQNVNVDDSLPKTTAYSPFGNYCNQLHYEINVIVDVPQSGTGEIIDIPGMMLMVLGMPFTFIAQAFDLTIFPGTYYQVNLAHIALAVLGAGLIIFVFKKFLK